MNKKRIIIITIVLILVVILGLWVSGIIPKQIARISATNYLKKNFPKIQLEYVNIEWSSSFGGYSIKFKDENNEIYSFIMNNKYFPVTLGQGLFGFEEKYREKYEKQENEIINVVTEVNLGERAWIDSPSKINIKNTNDYFEITKKVEWEMPEYEEGTTVSFSIPVPYTFVVNGVSYNGIYELDNATWNKEPEGLDYKLRVMNVTKDGKIEIEITKIKDNKESFSYEKLGNMALEYFFKIAPTDSLAENVSKEEYHVGISDNVIEEYQNQDMVVIEIRHINNNINNTLDARYYINIYTAKGFDNSKNEIDLSV